MKHVVTLKTEIQYEDNGISKILFANKSTNYMK